MEQTRPIWKSMVAGAIGSLIMMLLLSAIAAMLIGKSVVPEQSAALTGITITILSSFAGSIIAGQMQKGKLLLTCLGSSAGYLIAVLIIKAAFYGSWEEFNPIIALGIIASSLAASFVPSGKKRRRKRH